MGFFRVIKKTVKVSEHQEFVRSIVTDIPDRDGQIYGKDNFSIGSLYHLPEISYISLPKIGGYAISCQSEYFTRYSDAINQSDWRWHSELFVLQDGDYVRVQSDNNGPPIYTYSKTFYGLNPSKQYKITVKFGGNGDYTQTLYKIIPPR